MPSVLDVGIISMVSGIKLTRAASDSAPAVASTGWVTEGDSAFGEMSGSTPKSIHQQALRGIAKVLMEVRYICRSSASRFGWSTRGC